MPIKRAALLSLFAVIVSGLPVLAHHGTAAFEMEKLTTIKGTVTKFDFMNPHALIYVDVVNDQGKVENWVAEESSNNHLSRVGWEKTSLKEGDRVTIVGHRARNGARALELQCAECSVTDGQGKILPPG